ncbi:TPA: hypothetical protein DIS56_04035 [Candidatus Saccharibacteria bacterium]|nr:MAG: hypothetical protein A3F05_02940 [Candidatus Saccharibacteria bacterium RIFCSPHIGHO2_12_FULL_47_17]HCM52264.1 hypothetical protein [Candidatus Saccharibacteria bacterium]
MNTGQAINFALKAVGIAGLAGVVIVAPNAAQALELILRKSPAKTSRADKILAELRRQKLIVLVRGNSGFDFTLTPAGAHRLQRALIEELAIATPRKWDKKWRLVAFDVPVKFSKQRQYFTAHLRKLGLHMLQRSLWVHPFPCFDEVETLAGHYNLLRYCALSEVSKSDNLTARRLTRHFADQLKI